MADRVNENGVFEPDERLLLPFDRRGWQGMPLAEIELRDLGSYWIWSASFALMSADHLGSWHPLSDLDRYRAASRSEALQRAQAYLDEKLASRAKDSPCARRIIAWAGTLVPIAPVQGDLFGVLAQ